MASITRLCRVALYHPHPFQPSLLSRAFSKRTNPFRSISIFTHRLRVCATTAARRMAAKGYHCTSNYDQCVPSDLTTLFFAAALNDKCSRLATHVVIIRTKWWRKWKRKGRGGANKTLLIYTRSSSSPPVRFFAVVTSRLSTPRIFHSPESNRTSCINSVLVFKSRINLLSF